MESVVSTSTHTWTSPFGETATVIVTVTNNKPGYEGLYHWNYHVVNNDFGAFSGSGDGMEAFSLVVGEMGQVANVQTSMAGWVWQPTTLTGGYGMNWQGGDGSASPLFPGQSADFSFTTPVCGVGVYEGSEMASVGFAMTGGGQAKAPELMIRSVTLWGQPGAPDPVAAAAGGYVGVSGTILGANPNAGGGKRIFPELPKWNSPTAFEKVDVRVELSHAVTQAKNINLYQFDVDDPSGDNPLIDDELQEYDNRDSQRDQELGNVSDFTVTVEAGRSSGGTLRLVGRQPVDNYRFVASIDPAVTFHTPSGGLSNVDTYRFHYFPPRANASRTADAIGLCA